MFSGFTCHPFTPADDMSVQNSCPPLSGFDCFPIAQLKISLQALNPRVNLANTFF